MEQRDLELIEKVAKENPELAGLWQEHRALETEIQTMDDRVYLSAEEQMERKRLQKLKLAGRDRIEAILADHRQAGGR